MTTTNKAGSRKPTPWKAYVISFSLLAYFGYCGFSGEPFFWFLNADKWSPGGPGGNSHFHK